MYTLKQVEHRSLLASSGRQSIRIFPDSAVMSSSPCRHVPFFLCSSPSSPSHVPTDTHTYAIATASTVSFPNTLNLPLLIPRLFSILSSGSPLLRLINAKVIVPASTYFLPSNPLRPISLISSSASSAIICRASSTRSTGLFRESGKADGGGGCIIAPSAKGRLRDEALPLLLPLRRGSNGDVDEGEKCGFGCTAPRLLRREAKAGSRPSWRTAVSSEGRRVSLASCCLRRGVCVCVRR